MELMRLSRARSAAALLVLVMSAGVAGAGVGWSVVNLHPAGAESSIANGAYAANQVGSAVFGGVRHAGMWQGTAASWEDINPAGCSESDAYAITDGQIAGRASVAAVGRGALWVMGAGPVSASWVDLYPGWPMTMATAVGDEQQVGWGVVFDPEYADRACMWRGSAGTCVDLHPAGAEHSYATCVSAGVQGGAVQIGGRYNACIWRGSAASFVNMNPPDRYYSEIRAMSGNEQVGYVMVGADHASVWHGTPESWVDIHPTAPQVGASALFGTSGGVQVGTTYILSGGDWLRHAGVWKGVSESWMDLHQFLGPQYLESEATGVWSSGESIAISGYAHHGELNRDEAVVWLFEPIPPCIADFNGDGFVSFGDFDAFVTALESGAASADTNGDGFLTFEDFDVFVEAFEAGC